MTSRAKGFTLIELMIVVAIIAIIASIAIPNLLAARLNANEASAISTLRNICSAEQTLQAAAAIDCNNNGRGEYGYFAEMSSAQNLRTGDGDVGAVAVGAQILSPSVMSPAFGIIDTSGHVVRAGYVFRMSLPDRNRGFLNEPSLGSYPAVSGTNAEILWCCYAWPITYGNSGKRVFFINQQGDVLATSNVNRRYTGTGTLAVVPSAEAAFRAGSTSMSHSLCPAGALAADGQAWVVVN